MTINKLDETAKKLVEKYKEVYVYVLSLLKSQIDKGLSEQQSRNILREIQLTLKELDEDAYTWTYEVLPEYYYLSLENVDKDAAQLNNVNVIAGASTLMHKKALEKAVNDLYTDLAKNTQFMFNESKKIIRIHSEKLLTRMIISGESQKTIKKELKENLIQNGITSFVDAGRKKWSIHRYVDMAVRTKSRILHNEGTMNRLIEYQEKYPLNENFDLVQVSSHNAKDWCRFFENKVFSISGKSKKYPPVSMLPNGYSTLHPNCKHVFLPYMPSLRGEGEVVDSQWLNKSIKELNRIDYHLRKKA